REMGDMMEKVYKTFAKNPITANLTHFGRGKKYLNEARDQKSRNLASSALSYDEAINNLEIAHKNHPTSSEIKEILTQAHEEYEVILKELSISEIIENKFFKKNHFPEKIHLPLDEDSEPNDTRQLACELLQKDVSSKQKERLYTLARNIINRFAEIKIIDSTLVHEVMVLSHLPDSEKELYRNLMETFVTKIKESNLLHPPLLEGLSHIIRQANPKHREPDDLVCILEVLNKKFKNLRAQDKNRQIEMTQTLGRLFDVMADCKVQDLEYEELYKPLYDTFKKLQSDSNQELVYHAKYACQALICISNNKSPWKEFLQVFLGITNFAGAFKNIDPG
ncbi:14812_t:CDS:1, partial [Racocetra fulgida]